MNSQKQSTSSTIPEKRRKMADSNSETRVVLCESMPEGMTYPEEQLLPSIYGEWKKLIPLAKTSIDIAAFYVTLRDTAKPPHPTSEQGNDIFQALLEAGKDRGVKIRIAQNKPKDDNPESDCNVLMQQAKAEVRSLDFNKLVGAGVLHTKFIIVDNVHYYVGSANMDWRSLTQVKEVGACVYNNATLTADITKIFEVYWQLGLDGATVPDEWPDYLSTSINVQNPYTLNFEPNHQAAPVYMSSSPASFCPDGRTVDLDAILSIIDEAEEYIYICVMDYFPSYIFKDNDGKLRYWPVIDNRLRAAAFERGVNVRLMASWWEHSRTRIIDGLNSLQACDPHIETKLFTVPSTRDQKKIDHARVNHNKYMVTEKTAYIGTSNWTADYFVSTGGVGLVFHQPDATSDGGRTVRQQMKDMFERDWFSKYTGSMPPHGQILDLQPVWVPHKKKGASEFVE